MAQPVDFYPLVLKRGRGFLINDFVFVTNHETPTVLRLKCQNFKSTKCHATAKIQNGVAYLLQSEHTHAPPDIHAINFRAACLQKARNPDSSKTSLSNIYSDTVSQFTKEYGSLQAASQNLPSLSSIQSSIHRARAEKFPPAPKSITDIDIPFITQHLTASDGNSFLLASTQSHILIFGNDSELSR